MEFSTIIKRKNDQGKENHLSHMEIDKGCKSGILVHWYACHLRKCEYFEIKEFL